MRIEINTRVMSADDLPIGVYFQLEDYGWDEIEALPGADREYMADWDALACQIVENHFRQACRNIWPLLSDLNLKYISIGIDLLGTGRGEAGYYHLDSDMNTGNHGFYLTYEILREYLASHLNEKNILEPGREFRDLTPYCKYIWEHELIHLCDWKTLNEFKFKIGSSDIREYLIQFLLSYRNEGLADLWFALKGHSRISDPGDARKRFLEDLHRFEAAEWEDGDKCRQVKEEVMQACGFYSAGPWMILHILGCNDFQGFTPLVDVAAERIANGETVDDTEILEIIRQALKISNDDFVNYITNADYGQPFIDKKQLESLATRIGRIKHFVVTSEPDAANKTLVDFFEKHWKKI